MFVSKKRKKGQHSVEYKLDAIKETCGIVVNYIKY